MKKFIYFLCVSFATVNIANSSTPCACGSFESGMTEYFVEDGEAGCCRSKAVGKAYFTTWVRDRDGVWQVDTIKEITTSSAVNSCCNAA